MSDDQKNDDAKQRERDEKIKRLNRYRPAVISFMRRRGFTPDEVQDLTQEVFLRVCENVDAYRGDAAWGFLAMVARTVALNEIRDRHTQKRTAIELPLDVASSLPSPEIPVEQALTNKELSEQLRRAVAQLPPPLRGCVVSYLEGKSYQEIAKMHKLTISAVKSRLNAARHRLRELMGVDFREMGGE